MKFIIFTTDLKFTKINVIYFYSERVILHKKMIEIIKILESKYHDINFYAVNIDLFKDLVIKYEIDFLPKILIIDDKGKILKSITGMQSKNQIMEIFADIYS